MPTPPPSSASVDLTASGNFGTVDGAVFTATQVQPAGSGTFGTFVQIHAGGTEQGYNTSFRPQQFDELNSAPHNHALLLASVAIVEGDGTNGTVEGALYREFLLDADEPNGQDRNFLSLDALQIYQADVGNLTGFNQPSQQGGTGAGFGANGSLVYDLDAGGDNWIAVNAQLSHGSGESDVRVLIPDSLFDPNTPYVVVYSAFGYQDASWSAQGGHEEWATRGPQGNVPALNIAMTGTVPGGTADTVGEVITYAITVRNMGNVSLTGVTVTDPSVSDLTRGADIVGNNDGVLDVGEIWSYTAHHTVTQADIDSNAGGEGAIANTATADSDQTGPDTATVTVPVERLTQLEIVKESDVAFVDEAGDVIDYTVTIENTGITTLTNPVVNDLVRVPVLDFGAPVVNQNAQGFIAITDGDFNLGDTNQNNARDPGETFQYYYTGDTDLNGFHDVGETWPAFNLGDTDQDGIHDPGETWVGDTNQNGIEELGERWQFQNLGDTNQNGLQDAGETWPYMNAGDDNLNGVQDPGETFFFRNVGDTDQDGAEDAGETFQYYNAGDTNQNGVEDPGETFQFITVPQSLAGLDANNDGFNDGDLDSDGNLDFGEIWTYTGPSHTVTQEEIDNGGVFDPDLSIDNTADAQTDQTNPVTASASVAVLQDPEVTLTNAAVGGTFNDANANGRPDAGETISYTFTVANTGNMTLFDVDVTDPAFTVNGATIASLAPGMSDSTSFTGTYVIQQADIDAGVFDNTSTAAATAGAPLGHPVSHDDGEQVTLPQDPRLTVVNTGTWVDGDGDTYADVGEQIDYVITVFNDGNVTLEGVAVNDTLLGRPLSGPASGDTDNDGLLDVGETWTYEASYLITQADIDAGNVVNEATATALGPQDQLASDTDDNDAALPQNPHLAVTMAASIPDVDEDDEIDSPDDDITYAITIVNDGNVTLHDVQVTDSLLGTLSTPTETGGTGTNGDGVLDVGETWTYAPVYDVQQSDIDNRGSVDGTPDDNIRNDVTVTTLEGAGGSASADVPIDYLPAMELVKTGVWNDSNGNFIADDGETIDYIFNIENTGNVTLTNIMVSDMTPGVTVSGSAIASLAPGDIDTSWGASYTIDGDDVAAGFFVNEATADAVEADASDTETVDLPSGSSAFAISGSGGAIEKWPSDYLFN